MIRMPGVSINSNVKIPISELQFRFARSGGHGGQNVNKVETRVELLFDVARSPSLSDSDRERILKHLKSKIDTAGILRVVAQESRSQWRNREDAVKRFVELLRHALMPRKKRIKTRISAGGKERRLRSKKRRSEVKRLRRVREE
ncbi:MAG: alternative ribosome rescue aminoacyl-tRNA hydrolase ArfB [Bacteroidota bacterium]